MVNPIPVLTGVNPNSIGVGAFVITVTGSGFVSGSTVNFGGQALTTMFVSPTELTATGTATAAQAGSVQVTVTNPDPGGSTSGALMAQVVNDGTVISAAAAVRFLEQSTFGPSTEQVNQLQQTGFDTFLQSQFAQPVSTYPTPAPTDTGLGNVQQQFFFNAVNGTDQLRQRTGFALNEIWVVGENKVSDPTGYTNYIQTLKNDGLGNYYNVMRDVTLTAAMGHWLDMVNNDKPGTGQHANENYARELMQLFTLGLNQLNPDGTPVLDGSGNPVPTYTQDDVMALGRSFTGWTYPTQPGMTLQKHNPEYYGGPMVPFESNHDSGAKTFLGQSVAAGQSTAQELDSVLTIIFNHANLPPFVCKQLIEKLVTSNPSPAYVQRVAQAFISGKFNSYGSGKRGDMQATLAAILLDPEARRGDSHDHRGARRRQAARADRHDGERGARVPCDERRLRIRKQGRGHVAGHFQFGERFQLLPAGQPDSANDAERPGIRDFQYQHEPGASELHQFDRVRQHQRQHQAGLQPGDYRGHAGPDGGVAEYSVAARDDVRFDEAEHPDGDRRDHRGDSAFEQ